MQTTSLLYYNNYIKKTHVPKPCRKDHKMKTNHTITGTFWSEISEEIKIKTSCEYLYTPSEIKISYREKINAEQKPVNTLTEIKIINNKIIITRDTCLSNNTKNNINIITVDKNKRTLSTYTTPYGNLIMGITWNNAEIDLNLNGGQIFFSYDIDFNNQKSHVNNVLIHID